ncbi:hypothetical protein BDW68DRAFT_131047 [Aspergillus falconensis]
MVLRSASKGPHHILIICLMSQSIREMSYNVYRVAYAGLPRDRHAFLVKTNDDQSGHVFQVVGDIQNGMTHGHKPSEEARGVCGLSNRK